MSTGSINLDILLNQIKEDALAESDEALTEIMRRYPSLSEDEAREIHKLLVSSYKREKTNAELIVTAPASFAVQTKTTKNAVKSMIENAQTSILITGYSSSEYFSELLDCIIRKSQSGVFVRFFVNDIDKQKCFDKLRTYKGKFLKIYDYCKPGDSMAALHAKVISVDGIDSLITSANLSYHGQEGNIELGVRIVSKEVASQIGNIFTALVFKKVFVEI